MISIIIYANTLSFGHALDDDIVIAKNIFTEKGIKGIPDLLSKDTFHGFFKKKKNLVSGGRYRPFSLVTFAVESQVFGKKKDNGTFIYNPFYGHLINILIYAFSCWLIYNLFLVFMFQKKEAVNLSIVSGCVFLFALHPIHTEVVANIKGRDELLAFLLSIGALYTIFKYDNKFWAYPLSGLMIFLGLMSKENSITFLAIIPLCFYFFKTKNIKTLAIVTLPALAGSLFYLWIRYKIIGVSSPTGYCEILNDPFCGVDDVDKYATIIYTWLKYWGLLLFPIDLTHDYYPKQIPIKTWKDSLVVLSLLVNITLVLLSIYGVVKKKVYGFALAFYWICFSIVSNILFNVGTFMNERFLYFSSLGFCLMVAWGIWHLTSKAKSEKVNQNVIYGLVILIIGG
ncbi:MAG TPA: tetratricopeptide repeat protein, partial [Bacteroidetes bacterium]|nr:tetratricopeptide repeat protein [Bacteroidota bacterium]